MTLTEETTLHTMGGKNGAGSSDEKESGMAEFMKEFMEQQRKIEEERAERQLRADEERDKRMMNMFSQLMNNRPSTSNTDGETSFSGAPQAKTASLDAIEKQIRTFTYEPENGVTFDSWLTRHEEIFEQDLKEVEDGEKTRILLRHVSDRVDKQYRDHVLPQKPADLSFEQTLQQMKDLFGEKRSTFEKRLDIFSMKMSRLGVDDLRQFSARVNRTIEEATVKEMTTDEWKMLVFLAGIDLPRYSDVHYHLMMRMQRGEVKTLAEMITSADAMQEVQRDSKAVIQPNRGVFAVKAAQPGSHSEKNETQGPFQEKCVRCGSKWHQAERCRFKDKKCFECKKTGHAQHMCPQKEDNDPEESRSSEPWRSGGKRGTSKRIGSVQVNSLKSKRLERTFCVNGDVVKFTIDTGSDLTVVNESTWRKLYSAEMDPTDVSVVCANGEEMKLLGKFRAEVMLEGNSCIADVHVAQSTANLLGKDLYHKFFEPPTLKKESDVGVAVNMVTFTKRRPVIRYQPGVGRHTVATVTTEKILKKDKKPLVIVPIKEVPKRSKDDQRKTWHKTHEFAQSPGQDRTKSASMPEYRSGDTVLVKEHTGAKGRWWKMAVVLSKEGGSTYRVQMKNKVVSVCASNMKCWLDVDIDTQAHKEYGSQYSESTAAKNVARTAKSPPHSYRTQAKRYDSTDHMKKNR